MQCIFTLKKFPRDLCETPKYTKNGNITATRIKKLITIKECVNLDEGMEQTAAFEVSIE